MRGDFFFYENKNWKRSPIKPFLFFLLPPFGRASPGLRIATSPRNANQFEREHVVDWESHVMWPLNVYIHNVIKWHITEEKRIQGSNLSEVSHFSLTRLYSVSSVELCVVDSEHQGHIGSRSRSLIIPFLYSDTRGVLIKMLNRNKIHLGPTLVEPLSHGEVIDIYCLFGWIARRA